jgi:hypothetical protein
MYHVEDPSTTSKKLAVIFLSSSEPVKKSSRSARRRARSFSPALGAGLEYEESVAAAKAVAIEKSRNV